MSKQKVAEMRQKLERWKSHNEVNAKPADGLLYDFLSDFLSILEDDEDGYSKNTEQAALSEDALAHQSSEGKSQINATFDATDDADDTGGSTPPPEKGRG